jgi:hypothetical protein
MSVGFIQLLCCSAFGSNGPAGFAMTAFSATMPRMLRLSGRFEKLFLQDTDGFRDHFETKSALPSHTKQTVAFMA